MISTVAQKFILIVGIIHQQQNWYLCNILYWFRYCQKMLVLARYRYRYQNWCSPKFDMSQHNLFQALPRIDLIYFCVKNFIRNIFACKYFVAILAMMHVKIFLFLIFVYTSLYMWLIIICAITRWFTLAHSGFVTIITKYIHPRTFWLLSNPCFSSPMQLLLATPSHHYYSYYVLLMTIWLSFSYDLIR